MVPPHTTLLRDERVARIGDHVGASRSDVVDALKTAAGDRYDISERALPSDVVADARTLAEDRFATDEWNRQL
jgi:lipoate-protein ligase A